MVVDNPVVQNHPAMPAPTVYTLDENIAAFFLDAAPAQRHLCDEWAKAHYTNFQPAALQGQFSYTLVAEAESVVIQFRRVDSLLDLSICNLACSIHGNVVPNIQSHGQLTPELAIYVQELKEGLPYIFLRELKSALSDGSLRLREKIVADFAR